MTQGGYQVIIILTIKSKMAAANKQCFLRFLYWNESSPPSFKVRGLQMTSGITGGGAGGQSGRGIRLKKNTLSQSLRELFNPTRHAVFYFLFYFIFTSIGLCLHAHPKPKMTEKFQLPYFQKSNRILHVFWAPTCLNSSKTANFIRFS